MKSSIAARLSLLIVLISMSHTSSGQGYLLSNGCSGDEPPFVLCDTRVGLEWQLSGTVTAVDLFGPNGVTEQGFRIPTCREFIGLFSAASLTAFNICNPTNPPVILPEENSLQKATDLAVSLSGAPWSGRVNMHIADIPGTSFPPAEFPAAQGTLRWVIFGPPFRPSLQIPFGGVGGSAGNNLPTEWLMVRGESPDVDQDDIPDSSDNCQMISNTSQLDSDFDGFGNQCDADFNNDCVVNVEDLGFLRGAFFSGNDLADLNEDGIVNVSDLGIFRTLFFLVPGPSGHTDNCSNMVD